MLSCNDSLKALDLRLNRVDLLVNWMSDLTDIWLLLFLLSDGCFSLLFSIFWVLFLFIDWLIIVVILDNLFVLLSLISLFLLFGLLLFRAVVLVVVLPLFNDLLHRLQPLPLLTWHT